jgi:hypothetical protein
MTARKLIGILLGAALWSAVTATGASAASACPAQPAERAFLRWLDPALYVPFPDAGFEAGGHGWEGAVLTDANEPWRVLAPTDGRAARLLAGERLISPPVCVAIEHPTIRFFARNAGAPTGLLLVSVVLPGGLALPVGTVANPGPLWAPTLPMPVVANLLTLLGGSTTVRFQVAAVGSGSAWHVDDVMLDPYSKH